MCVSGKKGRSNFQLMYIEFLSPIMSWGACIVSGKWKGKGLIYSGLFGL